ncbi:MAG TPA: ATPase [Oscillatoriaceae cyanobacterium M33_DOE_052]|uniref:ATPase n=1 Tax=Planktothricoides sp. SpSt-374 TaxID=2282167 RepID=A0A7C3ZYU6_9CYAN|nr:ATPase [Oscillatoriaceae cyanobacterium M33_DOE_052]
MTVARRICLGFMAAILAGAILLTLPISLADGEWGSFVTALFTSTSAVCVTGLTVVDTGTYFSSFGQGVIALLIQIGGLGYMTASSFLLLLLGRKFRLRDKVALQQSFDKPGMAGVLELVRSIIIATLIIETAGVFLLMLVFKPEYGSGRGLWLSVFHSISAFNNAGFGLFPDNLMQYVTSPIINFTITALIILGGIGYDTIVESYRWVRDRLKGRSGRSIFSLQFKVATTTTLFLLIFGTVLCFSTEIGNPATLEPLSIGGQVMAAWFQSVTCRTAGFNTIDIGKMTAAGIFVSIILMFIGACPGSTGGGIKTTTARVLFNTTQAVIEGRTQVLCYQRQIPPELVLKAVGVFIGSLMVAAISSTLIAISDPTISPIAIIFEVVSAFATVGLSMGITASLSTFAKLVLVATMYIGRVGVLLLLSAILGEPTPTALRYPDEEILVG